MEFWKLLENLRPVLPGDQAIYLVGGAVRDFLSGRRVHDLDFALAGDTRMVARQVARRVGGSYFVLDDERNMARVIYTPPGEEERIILDFTLLAGGDLDADLRKRDFSINAIAFDVNRSNELIDPTGGVKDLRNKTIRACNSSALEDDPVRVLRGLRIANQLEFRILPATLKLMRQAAPLLTRTSEERRRDEVFKMLSGPRPAAPIHAMQVLDVLPYVLPELTALIHAPQSAPHIFDVWEHTLVVVRKLDQLLETLGGEHDPEKVNDLMIGLAVLQLGRFRQQIMAHLQLPLNPERPMRALLHLAALYHDSAKLVTSQVDEQGRIRSFGHEEMGARMVSERARALQLSNDEIHRLELIVRHHMRLHLLAQSGEKPSRRAIYRFFNDTGEAGVDICLLSLADTLATYGHTLAVDIWNAELEVCRLLFESCWEKTEEVVRPVPLVNGNDLMEALSLKQGPILGQLLEALREAQAAGQVQTREEALAYAHQRLEKPDD